MTKTGARAIVGLLAICIGCGSPKRGEPKLVAVQQPPPATHEAVASAAAPREEPRIDSAAVLGSTQWLADTLKLSQQGYKKLMISGFVLSGDGKYAIVNIANVESGAPGPWSRFLICSPVKKQIYFPDMPALASKDLGYPFVRALFNQSSSKAVLIVGYRSLVAEVIALPEGKVVKQQEVPEGYEESDLDKLMSTLTKED